MALQPTLENPVRRPVLPWLMGVCAVSALWLAAYAP